MLLRMPRFDRDKFFTAFNKGFGTLKDRSGLEFLLSKVETDPAWGKPLDLRLVSYFLATIKHETEHTFQPVIEKRERKTSKRRANQDRYWLSGYYGRGYVQITWKKNYQKFDIADNPEKALEPETAYRIASQGMLKGVFTGHRLTAYADNFVAARQVINGHDKAEEIAVIARKIQACLSLSLIKNEPAKDVPSDVVSVPAPAPAPVEASSQPSLMSQVKEKAKSGFSAYSSADESAKSLVGRVLQHLWVGIAGLIAIIQNNPVKTAIAVLVLVLGFIVLYSYVKRQDIKTYLKLGGKM